MNTEIKLAGEFDGVNFYHVPDHVGYAVSKCGRVRSLDRVIIDTLGRKGNRVGREIRQHECKKGYLNVTVHKIKYKTHRIVIRTFIGMPEKGMQVDHFDRNKKNNHIDNLRIVSGSINMHNREAKGCYFSESRNKWMASIMINRKSVFLGWFKERRDARSAYKKAKQAVLDSV